MAICHFVMRALKSTAKTSHAGRVVNYLTREGEYAPEVDYLTRESPTTKSRDDLRHVETAHLPAWAEGDAKKFFITSQAMERVNGRWATSIQCALPKEMSRSQQLELARDFVRTQLANKPTLWVLHEPRSSTGELQPHIHILFSERTQDGIERPAHQFFARYNREHPERGGCEKDPFFTQRQAITQLRGAWNDLTNIHLERAGIEARVDPRSRWARDLEGKAEKKVGPFRVEDLETVVHDTRSARDREKEQVLAAQGWELRKQRLEINDVHAHDKDEMLQKVYAYSRDTKPGTALPKPTLEQRQAEVDTLERSVQQLAEHERRVGAYVSLDGARERTGKVDPPDAPERRAQLIEEGVAHGIDVDDTARLTKPLIGNRVSKIYHEPTHKNYGDVSPKNQVQFWSVQDAKDAGYRRAANDHYGQGTGQAMEENSSSSQAHERLQARLQARQQHQHQRPQSSGAPKITAAVTALDVEDDQPHGPGLKARLTDRQRDGWSY
jgi:hypothetical protein